MMRGVPVQCVRCGLHERVADTFLCEPCLEDPASQREAHEALELAPSSPRTYVIERYQWAGGWRIGGRDHARA